MIAYERLTFNVAPSRASLRDADLHKANLTAVDLRGADLQGVSFTYACLVYADLGNADMRRADLRGADLRNANLSGVDLQGALLPADIPVVPHIDAAILEAIGPNADKLCMSFWHSECGTVHCRAGWTVVLAGEAGLLLEEKLGINAAASLIYAASTPGGCVVPDWYISKDETIADLRARAGRSY